VIVLKLKANHSSFACFGGPIGQLGPWGPWRPTGPHGGLWALYIYIHILCIYVYVSIYIHIQLFSAIYFVGCFQDAIKNNDKAILKLEAQKHAGILDISNTC
jgi:hypothetical protein